MISLSRLCLGLSLLLAAPGFAQSSAQPAAQPAPSTPVPSTNDSDWLYRGSDIARDPAWRFGTLPNGLRYAVRRNALPEGQVSIRVRIDVGALHEEDNERGWAHFLEHMLFKGTENYPDRRARQIWQELGASFGSDTNAQTSPTDTVYILNLPHATRAPLDTSLTMLAEMMMRARIEPAAVAAERPVVLEERGRRPELGVRSWEAARTLFYTGLRIAERETIGTEATLTGATAEGLRAFYRRWYRPERTTIVMVGDADPALMEELIRTRFGGWQAQGPAPADPGFGSIAEPSPPVGNLAYPGIPTSAYLAWLRPHEAVPHTMARERDALAETLALQIINRRLEAHARGESAFLSAQAGLSRTRGIADMTNLAVAPRGDRWRDALTQAYAILGDSLRTPPSAAEIARELANLRTAVNAAVQGDPTLQSQSRADQLANAIDSGSVVASIETVRANFEANAPQMTPERVGATMTALFTGSGPRFLLMSPVAVEGGETALAQGLALARAAAPAVRAAERQVSFETLPRPGPPGREVSRQRIEDLDVTIVRFANGSTLTFKRTEFERGSIQIRLRFGHGIAGLAPDRPSLGWLSGLIAPSGLADLDLDGLERLVTGRRIGLGFAMDEDAFVLSGQTDPRDLEDQLRLLTAKLLSPRWDAALFARFRTAAVESFNLHSSSAAARAAREAGGVLRPNDQRWRPIERAEMEAVTVEQFQAFFEPLLAAGPVHAIIVGDVELETAVAAMRGTVAALPRRAEAPVPANAAALSPPAPNPAPRTFTHEGDPNQAFALIGWSTLGGNERIAERRALALAANIFETRLFDRLREEEGATYAPDAGHVSAEAFPAWGVLTASAEIRPANAPTFYRIAREIIADLAANPVQPDEFTRAQNPVISGIERVLATNAYWVGALENWHRDPRDIANVRTYLTDYRALTPEDVRRAVATYVTEQGDWSMLVLPARGSAAREANGE